MTKEDNTQTEDKMDAHTFIERLQKASTEINTIKSSFSKGMDDLAKIQTMISMDGVHSLNTMIANFEDRIMEAERKRLEAAEGARKFGEELEKEKERLMKLWDAYKNQEEELSNQEKRAQQLEDNVRDIETSKKQLEGDLTNSITTLNKKLEEKEQKLIQLEQLEQRTKDFETIRTDLENNVNQLTCDVTNKNETIKTLEAQVEELQKFKQFEEFKHKFDEISVEYEKEKDRLTKLFRLYEETEAENQHLKKEVSKWETWFNQNEDLFNKLFSSVDTLRKTPSPTSTTQSTPKPQQPKPQQPVNPPSNQQDSGNKKKSKGKLRFKR